MGRTRLPGLVLLATLLALASCRDDAGAPSIYTGTPSPLSGVYAGQAHRAGALTPPDDIYIGAVAPNGVGYFASPGSILATPGLTASGNFDTIATFFAPDPAQPGMLSSYTEDPSHAPAPYSVAVSASTVQTTATNVGISYATVVPLQFQPNPGVPGSVTAGQYQGRYFQGSTVVNLTVSTDGRFTGSDTLGCSISGALVPVANADEFQVSGEVSGSSLCAGGIYGVAFLHAIDSLSISAGGSGPFLYVVAVDRNYTKAFAVELQL